MPIYEYRCEKCGIFEETQRITDPPLDRCPTCRRKVRRLISNTSFQLKGGGWYVTDYARAGRDGSKAGTDAAKDSRRDGDSATGTSSGKSEATSDKSGTSTKTTTKAATADA